MNGRVKLLRVRHRGQAEQRYALLVLLVNRLGLRCSDDFSFRSLNP